MGIPVVAAIASAQESTDQSSSDTNSSTSTDQTQSPTSQQEAAPSEQATSVQNAPTVRISANGFDPAQVDVPPGTPLNFVNEDTVPHTVVLKGLFSTAEIPAGYSYPVTLNGAGTVTY